MGVRGTARNHVETIGTRHLGEEIKSVFTSALTLMIRSMSLIAECIAERNRNATTTIRTFFSFRPPGPKNMGLFSRLLRVTR